MTLAEFSVLDHRQRLNAINEAVCIGGRNERGQTVLLYQLNSFYIEAYHEPRKRHIIRLNGFEDLKGLTPYLQQLKIAI